MTGADMKLSNRFDRYRVRKYEGGKITEAVFRENFIYDEGYGGRSNDFGFYEMLGRDLMRLRVSGLPSRYSGKARTMEMLGFPGPSFHYQFQEDSEVYAGSIEQNRYPVDQCYSYWLTVPNCSKKVWVDGPCIVRVSAMFYALFGPSHHAMYVDIGTIISPNANKFDSWSVEHDKIGRQMAGRVALIVDTNPDIPDDEFVNTNPNLLVNGVQAANKSWEIIREKKIYVGGTHCKEGISGDIVLKGNRYYNFSLKFRDAATIGYVVSGTFYDGTYEVSVAHTNFNSAYYNSQGIASTGLWEVMWLSQSLHLEFFYGHGGIVSDSSLITNLEG